MKWEYSPAPESRAIAEIKDRYKPFVDGAFKEGGVEDSDNGHTVDNFSAQHHVQGLSKR